MEGRSWTLHFISRLSIVPTVSHLHHQPAQLGPFLPPGWGVWTLTEISFSYLQAPTSTYKVTRSLSPGGEAFMLSFVTYLLSIYPVASAALSVVLNVKMNNIHILPTGPIEIMVWRATHRVLIIQGRP